jgi:hypothetical protein
MRCSQIRHCEKDEHVNLQKRKKSASLASRQVSEYTLKYRPAYRSPPKSGGSVPKIIGLNRFLFNSQINVIFHLLHISVTAKSSGRFVLQLKKYLVFIQKITQAPFQPKNTGSSDQHFYKFTCINPA